MTTFAPARVIPTINANVKHNPNHNSNPNPNPDLNPPPTPNQKPNHYPHSNPLLSEISPQEQLLAEHMLDHHFHMLNSPFMSPRFSFMIVIVRMLCYIF